MSEALEIEGLRFEVRRSPRRKTLGLTVDRGAELVIHAPEATSTEELSRWARSRLLWVHRKLALKEELAPRVREPEYVTGESFSYLGRAYRLAITDTQGEPLRFDGGRFHLRRDARDAAVGHFRRWDIAVGSRWIERRTEHLIPRVGGVPNRIEVSDLGYHWGTCGKDGTLLFNWKLLQLPVRLADYVIAHELAHLIEPHHGPGFWQVLDRAMPDWKSRQDELRAKAREVYWCAGTMAQ